MPRGATPSRWCVCQFHHFRTGSLSKYSKAARFFYRAAMRCPVLLCGPVPVAFAIRPLAGNAVFLTAQPVLETIPTTSYTAAEIIRLRALPCAETLRLLLLPQASQLRSDTRVALVRSG